GLRRCHVSRPCIGHLAHRDAGGSFPRYDVITPPRPHADGEMTDPYRVLGVDKSADAATIRKAYKKLARQWHPDVNKDPKAEERFKQINAAYDVLGDDEKRRLFDEFGEVSLRPGFDADQARAWKQAGGG